MNEIEVIDLVLDQICGVRIQLRDDDTRMRLQAACQNLEALREALLKAKEEAETETEETILPEEVNEDV